MRNMDWKRIRDIEKPHQGLLPQRRRTWGFTAIEIAIGLGLLTAGGFIVSKVIGSGKKNEGRQEAIIDQKEAKEAQDREITKYKNQYLKIQVPKRRRYQEVTDDPDSTPEERANATFDLYGTPKGK